MGEDYCAKGLGELELHEHEASDRMDADLPHADMTTWFMKEGQGDDEDLFKSTSGFRNRCQNISSQPWYSFWPSRLTL